jgi:hypothetical protein
MFKDPFRVDPFLLSVAAELRAGLLTKHGLAVSRLVGALTDTFSNFVNRGASGRNGWLRSRSAGIGVRTLGLFYIVIRYNVLRADR